MSGWDLLASWINATGTTANDVGVVVSPSPATVGGVKGDDDQDRTDAGDSPAAMTSRPALDAQEGDDPERVRRAPGGAAGSTSTDSILNSIVGDTNWSQLSGLNTSSVLSASHCWVSRTSRFTPPCTAQTGW